MARGSAGAPAACGILPRRFHFAGDRVSPDAAPSPTALRLALSRGCAELAHSGRRSATVGGTDRCHGHPAHLGAESDVSSPSALCGHRRWAQSGRQPLDRHPAGLPVPREGLGPVVSRQIPGRTQARLPGRTTVLGRQRRGPGRPSRYFVTWAAIPTAWLLPTPVCSPWKTTRCFSTGGITRTTTASRSCG